MTRSLQSLWFRGHKRWHEHTHTHKWTLCILEENHPRGGFVENINCFAQECPQPCIRLGIVAKLVGREISPSHQINLIFAPEVEVTKSVLTVSGINLMSNLGGSLGLMLGLGLLQIVQLLTRGLDTLMDFIREHNWVLPNSY